MYSNFDIGDLVGAPFFTLGTAVSTGIATVSVFGESLSNTAFSVGTTGISYAFILSVLAIVVALASNNMGYEDIKDLPDEEMYAFVIGVATIVALEFVTEIQNLVGTGDFLSVVAMGVASAAYVVVGYRPMMFNKYRS